MMRVCACVCVRVRVLVFYVRACAHVHALWMRRASRPIAGVACVLVGEGGGGEGGISNSVTDVAGV